MSFEIANLKRLMKRLAALVVLAAAAVVLCIELEHRSSLTLPEPTGPFAVGRTTYEWVNADETDELAPDPRSKREVLVWLWYPAELPAAAQPAEYLPAAWREAVSKYSGPVITLLTRDLGKVRAHSYQGAEVARAEPNYPVVLMRAGLGALTVDYTTLAEDLASRGYVVVGFDAPYRTFTVVFADGRVVVRRRESNPETLSGDAREKLAERLVRMWCEDARFVTDQLELLDKGVVKGKLTGRLDLERLGMFGHSLGGAEAAEFCHQDTRCRAGIDVDGRPFGKVIREGIDRPFLFLMSDHHGEPSAGESQQILADIRRIYDTLPEKKAALVTIAGTNHFSFSDQILLKSQLIIGTARFFGVGGRVDGRRGLAITRALLGDFFDTYLKGLPGRANQLRAEYPELTAETR